MLCIKIPKGTISHNTQFFSNALNLFYGNNLHLIPFLLKNLFEWNQDANERRGKKSELRKNLEQSCCSETDLNYRCWLWETFVLLGTSKDACILTEQSTSPECKSTNCRKHLYICTLINNTAHKWPAIRYLENSWGRINILVNHKTNIFINIVWKKTYLFNRRNKPCILD